jgi:hypothetical protein
MDEDCLENLWRDLDKAETGLSRPKSWHDDDHDDDAFLTWSLDRGNWSPHRSSFTAGKGTLVEVEMGARASKRLWALILFQGQYIHGK